MSPLDPPWARLPGFKAWSPPQRCPYCLEDARVEQDPREGVVRVSGCGCPGEEPRRVPEALARRRWQQLGVRWEAVKESPRRGERRGTRRGGPGAERVAPPRPD